MLKTAMLRSVLIAIACALSVAAHAYAADPKRVDVPAGDLTVALEVLARQSGLELIYQTDQLKGLRTRGVTGNLSPEEAVVKLLDGTNLTLKRDPSGAMLIARPLASSNPETPVPGSDSSRSPSAPQAINSAKAPVASTQKKTGWLDRFRLAQNESSSQSENASDREGGPLQNSDNGSEDRVILEVVVTGSRLKRMSDEGPSPVIVISRQDIDRSGAATTREVLNTITQNAVAPDESGNVRFLGASTVQLRGLPVGTTLMLLNGRRLGASGAQVSSNFFDLNNIPLEAVERIEVLTDSASAIYGADAIGGAVNVILKSDFEGAGASVRLGSSAEGDATERNAALTFGGRGESFSGLLVLDYFDRDPLRGTDRDLTSSFDFTRFGGEDFRSTFSYPGNVYSVDFAPLPGLTNSFAAIPAGTDGTGLTPADFQATDGTLNRFDGAPYSTLLAEAERKSVFASGRYTVSPAFSVFGEALFTDREQTVQFTPDALLLGQFAALIGLPTVPATNPFNPFGVPIGVDYRFVELGPRVDDSTTDFSRFLLGASGAFSERFDWDVYLLADRDHTEVFNRGSVNSFLPDGAAVVQQFLDSTDPAVALNVFSTSGNNNPATLAAILAATQTTDDLTTRAHMAEAVIRGALFDLPAGPLGAVLGVNARREKVDFLSPLAGDLRDERDSKAAFTEVSVPLVSAAQSIAAIHSLQLSAALRHDRYADLDSSTNPQFGLTWRPVPSLLLRGSYGEAFKAPTAFDLFFPRLDLPSSALDPARGGEPSEFIQTFGGNPGLAPEEGNSTTIGLVWEPSFAPGLSLAFSGFRVEQENFITSLEVDLILQNEALFPGRVVRAPPDPSDPPGFAGRIISVDTSFINFGRLTVKGADAQLQYAFPRTAAGEFVASLNGTYIDEYRILITPGTDAINRVDQANDAGYPVRFKGNAGVSWSGLGGWSTNVTARYLGSYTDYDGVRELPSQTVFDAQLGYRLGDGGAGSLLKRLDTALGVINLTDEQGDFSNSFAGYDSQQSDIRGRFYYLSLKASF